jgi:hypothetical protein
MSEELYPALLKLAHRLDRLAELAREQAELDKTANVAGYLHGAELGFVAAAAHCRALLERERELATYPEVAIASH